MNRILIASLCTVAASAFMAESVETITVGGVRVNKADYEADQQKPAGEREFKGTVSKGDTEQSIAGVAVTGDTPPLAAPSAPDFNGPDDEGGTVRIDPLKNAAAPVVHGENSRLVMKEGKNYVVVDQNGQKLSTEDLGGVENSFKTDDLAWAAIRALPH